jgi:hypothetical protein
MPGQDRNRSAKRRPARASTAARCAAALAIALLACSGARAEQVVAPSQAPNATPPGVAPTPASRPGLLDTIGRVFDDSVDSVKAGLDSARDTLGGLGGQAGGAAKGAADAATGVAKGAADVAAGVSGAATGAAKGAADSVVRLPATRLISGRERCAMAPNGAPDCRAAASALCKANGFGQGNSVDMQSAEKCPARVYISGRQSPGDCSIEHFVTSAMCQ